MSNESDETRPKLKLTRDTQPKTQEDVTPTAPQPDTEAAAHRPKLKIGTTNLPKQDTEKAPPPLPVTLPPQATGSAAPQTQYHAPNRTPSSAAPPSQQHSQEIDRNLNRLEARKQNDNTVGSVLILIALFLILSGAGIGIWWVLKQPADDSMAERTEADTPQGTEITLYNSDEDTAADTRTPQSMPGITLDNPRPSTAKTPIDRAKETIARVPVTEIPDINASVAESSPAIDRSQQATAPANATKMTKPPVEDIESARPTANTALQLPVTDFLSSLYINGVRRGDNPRLTIGSHGYAPGDLVDAATGLTFVGIRDDKLLFKDRNGIYYLKSF